MILVGCSSSLHTSVVQLHLNSLELRSFETFQLLKSISRQVKSHALLKMFKSMPAALKSNSKLNLIVFCAKSMSIEFESGAAAFKYVPLLRSVAELRSFWPLLGCWLQPARNKRPIASKSSFFIYKNCCWKFF